MFKYFLIGLGILLVSVLVLSFMSSEADADSKSTSVQIRPMPKTQGPSATSPPTKKDCRQTCKAECGRYRIFPSTRKGRAAKACHSNCKSRECSSMSHAQYSA